MQSTETQKLTSITPRHVFIVGKSGSGKSTLLKNMVGDFVINNHRTVVYSYNGKTSLTKWLIEVNDEFTNRIAYKNHEHKMIVVIEDVEQVYGGITDINEYNMYCDLITKLTSVGHAYGARLFLTTQSDSSHSIGLSSRIRHRFQLISL